MNRFFKSLIKRKITIPLIFLVLVLISILLLPYIKVNYDMADYLPADSGTKKAISILKEEFDYPGTAEAMINNVSISEAYSFKQKIAAVPGVKDVIWLDDVVSISQPEQFIPPETLKKYYVDRSALFMIEFDNDNYSSATSQALDGIKKIDPSLIVAGNAENANHMKNVLTSEIIGIVAFVLPICLMILILASHSWFEPILYLIVIGTSIAINMGTNSVFSNISFITYSMSSVLQLAICMDYLIFLLHRYFEERDLGNDVPSSVRKASVKSASSIAASALTTIAGFLALLFMRYRIGMDVGLVLAKGIAICLITVMVLMPVLINLFSKVIDRTRHRFLLPSFGKIGKMACKARYLILAFFLILIVPVFMAQSRNDFFYGDNSVTQGEGQAYENKQQIVNKFGVTNNVVILIPSGNAVLEKELADVFKTKPYIKEVISLATVADTAIPETFLPKDLTENFTSDGYSRMILFLNTDGETKDMFNAVADMRVILQEHFPDKWYAAGMSTSLADIRDTARNDGLLVTVISLLAVGLVILVMFRSFSIPLVLLFVIQSAVWINMSIPYFSGFKMAFIGYLVISSLQLGATIDYGILISNRYIEFRHDRQPAEAAFSALKASGHSITVSALILASAGFGFGIVSRVSSISELGLLIGRGALISCGMTLILLPAMLTVFDKLIIRTTLKRKVKA
jgi:uncharacterized protein